MLACHHSNTYYPLWRHKHGKYREGRKSRARSLTFTFLLFLATVMVYTCRAVVPKTETPITDARWKKVLLRRDRKKKRKWELISKKKVITIPVTNRQLAALLHVLSERESCSQGAHGKAEVNHPFPDSPHVKGIQRCIVGMTPVTPAN